MARLVAGLDLGTTKVCLAVGSVEDGGVRPVALEQVPARGMFKGQVVDVGLAAQAVREVIGRAEERLGRPLRRCPLVLGVGGKGVVGHNRRAIRSLSGPVRPSDVEDVLRRSRKVYLPPEQEIFQVIPQEYAVDDQRGIVHPLDMEGQQLEAQVHLLIGPTAALRSAKRCVNRAGFLVQPGGLVFGGLATAEAVLTPEERQMGIAVVDVGGGTMDLAVLHRGVPCYTSTIPLGGENLTWDLAFCLRISRQEAEETKHRFGHALPFAVEDEAVEVGKHLVSRRLCCEILWCRLRQMMERLRRELTRSGLWRLLRLNGLVITGGSSLLAGVDDLAERTLGMPVRLGYPLVEGGELDPRQATALGLLRCWERYDLGRAEGGPMRRLWMAIKEAFL